MPASLVSIDHGINMKIKVTLFDHGDVIAFVMNLTASVNDRNSKSAVKITCLFTSTVTLV